MTEERKYLLAGTDEEVLLGDVIVQTLVKNFKNGRKIEREIEFKLTEETLPYALDMGLVEEIKPEKEEEKDNSLIDFNDEDYPYEETLQRIIEDMEALEKRADKLEEWKTKFEEKFNNFYNQHCAEKASK